METFAFLVGAVSLILAVLTIVILFILRKNLIDILNKDALIFNENYQIKKSAIEKAMLVVDEIESGMSRNIGSAEYAKKINSIYNELLCVVTDTKVANTFYEMAFDRTKTLQPSDFINFKFLCRKDLGLKSNKIEILSKQSFAQQATTQPAQPSQQPKPATAAQPTTAPKPAQPRPVQAGQPSQPGQPAVRKVVPSQQNPNNQ